MSNCTFKSKVLLILLFFLSCSTISIAQKEGYIWYFGQYAGLNFNTGYPVPILNSAMYQHEGCATISDSNGVLQFYTNGMTVWNRNHNIMHNGTGLLGGYTSTQSSVIIKKPGSSYIYYIFTVDNEAEADGFRYSIVNMNHQSGLGAITSKNIFLLTPTVEKVSAVGRNFDNSIWVMTHSWNSNAFYAYLITENGISSNPIISNVGSNHSGTLLKCGGYMKASPDGNKLAVAVQSFTGFCELFDFNNSTGIVSNSITLPGLVDPYGLEFSPDGSKLYITSQGWKSIYQFDLSSGNPYTIRNSKTVVDTSASQLGALQVAIDGKIYVARQSDYLGVITNPNSPGQSCNYIDNGVYLGGKPSKFGLPTFNQSYFFNPDISFVNACEGDSTKFHILNPGFIDSLIWNFGDPGSGAQNHSKIYNPTHVFSHYGNFVVKLVSYHNTQVDTTVRIVQIDQNPNVDFYIDDTLQCINSNNFQFHDSSNYLFGNLSYEWFFGDQTTSTDADPTHIYYSSDTFYPKLRVTSFQGCRDSISKAVYVMPAPNANYSMNDSSQCFDQNNFIFTNSTSISVGSCTYFWNLGDGTKSDSISPQHSYSTPDTYSIKLVATSNFGCKDSISKNAMVHIHPMPVADFSFNDSTQCLLNNDFIFTNNSSISSGSINYTWRFGDGDTSIVTDTSHTYSVTDTYQVMLINVSDFGCVDTIVKNAFVHPMPIADFLINDSSQCFENNAFRFTDKSAITSGTLLSIWDFGDSDTSHLKNPPYAYKNHDTFVVQLISRSKMGCNDTAYKKVYIHPMPQAAFSINDVYQCLGDNEFKFEDTSSIPSGSINSYFWDLGDGITSTSNKVTYSYSNYDTFTIKFLISSGLSCKDTLYKTVFVFPNPKVDFIIDTTSLCLDENEFFFLDKSTIVYGIIDTFLWRFGDGNSSLGQFSNYSYSDAGDYNFKHIVISDNGCKDSSQIVVNVRPMPEANFITNDSSQCFNGHIFNFNNQSTIASGSVTYYWSFGDNDNSTNDNPSKSYSSYGTYSTELLVTSEYNCKDSITKDVFVNPMPVAKFSIDNNTQCLQDNLFVFTNNTEIVTGSISSNLWYFGDSTFIYKTSPSHQYQEDNTYIVSLVAYSGENCKDSIAKTVIVHPMPKAKFINTMPCLDQITYFTDLTSINSPDIIFSWQWTLDNSSSSNNQNPSLTYSIPGSYTAKLHVVSNNQCEDSVSKTFTVHEHIDSNSLTRVTVKGPNIHIFWTAASKGNPKNYIVERADNNSVYSIIGKTNRSTYEYIDPFVEVGNQSYKYRVKILDSCNYSSPYTNIGKSILLKVSTDSDYPILTWTGYEEWSAGVKNYKIQIKDNNSGLYQTLDIAEDTGLTYTDFKTKVIQSQYCYRVIAQSASDTTKSYSNEACVTMPMTIFIPNSFTPNDDNVNDSLEIKGKYILEYQVRIYNKWGEEVFKSFDILNCWDGTFKGKECPTGMYYINVVALGTLENYKTFNETLLLLR